MPKAPETTRTLGATEATEETLLSARAVRKTWADAQLALQLERIDIDAGQVRLLTGSNGSGKTTLLRILAGFLGADPGAEIFWRGQRQQRLQPGQQTCLSQQDPYMLGASVAGNVDYALRKRASAPATTQELLAAVGLEQMASRSARELSGGEQRRLALARACATDAPLLLLDEPTANLDDASTQMAVALIKEQAKQGRAVLVATPGHSVPAGLATAAATTLLPPFTA